MIHGTYGSTVDSYLTLEDQRIDTTVVKANIRYLFKFTNDLTKTVKYCYGKKFVHKDRYVRNAFLHNTTENLLNYEINFKPYGYWKYEVYEVSWIGSVSLTEDTAPANETTVLPVHNSNGVVQGKVEEGKLYVTETVGSEQVSYTEYSENDNDNNYLYTN